MKPFSQVAAIICLYLFSAATSADLRVLFRFDESGHHVHSVTKAPVRLSLRQGIKSDDFNRKSAATAGRARDVTMSAELRILEARRQMPANRAILLWFDETGEWLSNSIVSDPRVAHSPAHISGLSESYVSLNSGAWLVNGPDEADSVTLILPDFAALGLGSEQWSAVLPKR